MTPQEINENLERMAMSGKSAEVLSAFLVEHGAPKALADENANAWVKFYTEEQAKIKAASKPVLPPFDGHKLLNQELSRLNEMFEHLGSEVFDPKKIWTTVEDWSAGITQNLLMFWREEYEPMDFPIGTRVRRVEPENYVSGSSSMQYGEIIVNHFRYLLEQNPHEDLTPARSEEQKIRLKFLGGLHAVQWYDRDGNKVCISFSRAEQLVKLPES